MNGTSEDSPRIYDTEQSSRDLGLANLEVAAMFLGETSYPESTPSERAVALARHRRRMYTEALRAPLPVTGAARKSVEELMNEADQAVIDAIAANDGSLEQLIEASRLREQARLESEKSANQVRRSWRPFRKAGKTAVRSVISNTTLVPKPLES